MKCTPSSVQARVAAKRAGRGQRVQADDGARRTEPDGATTLNEYQKYIEKDAALELVSSR